MYNVASRFHTLAIADSPKTRCRIYFITDAVNCWDDADVQSNGTLLVGAAGDTDSNGRIGQGGVTVTEIFNKDKNLTIGGTVSYQIGMTLVNSDGALNNFAFGRCKVYLDVYDDANSTWLPCPLGVFRIELPVKRRVQLISCTGYDQMQALNATADTWWNGLNFTGGLTIENILNSMVTQLGLHLSATSSTNMVNTALSFTTPPIDSVERTYRDILGWIAEATGTVAHFNRDGELDMRQYITPQIGGNNIVIDTDTTGNQCLSIDVAEYSVSQIDALTIKLTTADQGVTVGSGTNVYTIMDNPFLYGPDVATIQGKLTPIYNRLSAYATYSPISTRLIYDWSIEAGDIIYILNNSTTYNMPIFQQKMVWRGGYVTSELISSGDTVRPQVSSSERETYRYNVEMATKVGDNEIISKINQTAEQIQIQASKVNLTGYITATNLATPGQTVIDGGNITTGSISADRISGGTLTVGGLNNANGTLTIKDANNNTTGTIDNTGATMSGSFVSKSTDAYSTIIESSVESGAIQIVRNVSGRKTVVGKLMENPFSSTEYYARLLMGGEYGGHYYSANYNADGITLSYDGDDYFWVRPEIGLTARKGIVTSDLVVSRGATIGTDLTINGVLDVTKRRCNAVLSSGGWYRILRYDAPNSDAASGVLPFEIEFFIGRVTNTTTNELHKVTLFAAQNYFRFNNEISQSQTFSIDKVRAMVSGSTMYVDIHYAGNSANVVYVDFSVHCWWEYMGLFAPVAFNSVAPSPQGETPMTTYEFTANGIRTVTLTSAHSSVTINDQKVAQSGQVVSLWVDFTVSASISGYDFLINTPTFATAANALVYDTWNTVQTNVRLYADEGNHGLRCYGSFPAGRYIAFITYITTDV